MPVITTDPPETKSTENETKTEAEKPSETKSTENVTKREDENEILNGEVDTNSLIEGETWVERKTSGDKSGKEEKWIPTRPEVEQMKNHFLKGRSGSYVDGDAYTQRVGSLTTDASGEAGSTTKLNDAYPRRRTVTDPACNPEHPVIVQFQDVSAAAYKIRGGIEKTPCNKSHKMSNLFGMDVYFKKDFLQVTGSFKERGARFTLMNLDKEQKESGVVAASAGNHALALSYHGGELGVPVTVVMPVIAPIMKVSRCREYGTTVLVQGADVGEAKEIAMKLAEEKGFLYINGYDHPNILAGAGTTALEIIDQVPDLDAVVIPVGGGGLLAGMAVAIKFLYPKVKVIGVESENCPGFSNALKHGRPTYTKPHSTLADGLSVPVVGVNAFATAKLWVDEVLTVSETDIARAILYLVEIEKAVVEGAGAIGVAALLSGKLNVLKGKKVVFPLGGGNIDTTVLGRCLDRGLAAEGRLVRFVVTIRDRPGGIAELTALMAKIGVSIKDIFHERAWLKYDIHSVRVKCVVETIDWNHASQLEEALRYHYGDVIFSEGPEMELS
jgi:threonine dehydratase